MTMRAALVRGQMIRLLSWCLVFGATALAQESRRAAFDASSFTPLFDGRSLDGFVTSGGRYDGAAAWAVEDGAICGREGKDHAGGLLYTARSYACFVLSLEVWMTRPNDSGVFVRMAPDARGFQVTLDDRDDGEIGAVYSDAFLAHNATARAAWVPRAWNRVEVRCTGRDARIEAWLNGSKITDHRVAAGTPGFAPSGLVGLQVHGNRDDPPGTVVKFRDLRIRELPVVDDVDFDVDLGGAMAPTETGARRGWRLLHAAGDLAAHGPAWIDDGFVATTDRPESRRGVGVLRTAERFRDFELHLDFMIAEEGANSGIFLRADPADANAAFSGCEVQILDDYNWERLHGNAKLEPAQRCGSIYGSSAPRVPGTLHGVGRWNSCRIVYEGPRLRVDLNNVPLQDADTLRLPVPSGTKPFADRRPRGFVGLQRHDRSHAAVAFRNVFVRALP